MVGAMLDDPAWAFDSYISNSYTNFSVRLIL